MFQWLHELWDNFQFKKNKLLITYIEQQHVTPKYVCQLCQAKLRRRNQLPFGDRCRFYTMQLPYTVGSGK